MGNVVRIDKSPIANAVDIGDYLVCFGRDVGDPLTNLKLQKLLYYAQGLFIAKHNRILFGEPLRAWVRGPVVYEVWAKYRGHRWQPITGRISKPSLPQVAERHLAEVVEQYWNFSAFLLERMTHKESPWINARQGIAKDTPSSAPIPIVDLHEHFSKLLYGRKKAIPRAATGR